MNSKQECIAKAYGNYADIALELCDENGWIPLRSYYTYLPQNNQRSECGGFIRPKSLQGIENNNGWIKIESEDDLPKEDNGEYWMIERRTKDIVYETDLMTHNKTFIVNYFTHYQTIEKPKPPLY